MEPIYTNKFSVSFPTYEKISEDIHTYEILNDRIVLTVNANDATIYDYLKEAKNCYEIMVSVFNKLNSEILKLKYSVIFVGYSFKMDWNDNHNIVHLKLEYKIIKDLSF